MSSFVVVTQRMLQEHLQKGIYEQKMQSNLGFCKETKSVHNTNVGNERSFGSFGAEMNRAPKR